MTDTRSEIVAEAVENFARKLAQIRRASLLEIFFYLAGATALLLHDWTASLRVLGYVDFISLVTSPQFLAAIALVFLSIFSFILNDVTPIIGALSRKYRPEVYFENFSQILKKTSDAELPGVDPSSEVTGARSEKEELDPIESNFFNYLRRSQTATKVAQGRPLALLYVGTFIAFGGLLFFVLTLPGSRYGFLDITPAASASVTDLKTDFWATSIQLIPRLLMLVFIQVLAGFFLRQYRSAMEDFRYYESVLRHREAQYLSYTLRKRIGDEKALLKFADDLLRPQEFGVLTKGGSTTTLEAQRSEMNEFASLYERLGQLIARSPKPTKASDVG